MSSELNRPPVVPGIVRVVSIPFEENCYIVHREGDRRCVVIDPGLEPEKIAATIRSKGLLPEAILNTHGHSDHIGGNAELKRQWPDCPIVIGAGDADKLGDPTRNLSAMFGGVVRSPKADILVGEGDVHGAADLRFEVLAIPGHTTGHVVYLCRDFRPMAVFVGDVIFAGSVGRTDFPGGDFDLLITGIRRKLFTLPDDTMLLPGHGPATRVGDEKLDNPFAGEG